MTISKDAFETQVLAILGPLHGVARRLTRNEADAEDLVAESVTRAWRARASLADTGAFRAWMFRILNNTFISERRKTLARPREELLVDASGEEGVFSIFERLHQPFLLWFANPEQEFLDKLLREDLDQRWPLCPSTTASWSCWPTSKDSNTARLRKRWTCPSAPFDPGSLARAARCNGRYGMSPAITASRLRGRPALTDSAPGGIVTPEQTRSAVSWP